VTSETSRARTTAEAPAGPPRVTVLIPCHNEAPTVGKVVDDFRRELPGAAVVVVDNGSTDATASVAAAHGAAVLKEPRRGKGFAVESMFDYVEADVYVMVDGDDTYPAARVHDLLAPVLAGEADMAVATRLDEHAEEAFRPWHLLGNNLVRRLVNWVGRARLTDILSGYRALSRDAVARLPVVASGFEIETELTLQMLYYRRRLVEVPVAYGRRPQGSASKLRTFRDGFRVLWRIFTLFRAFKPLTFFGALSLGFAGLGVLAGIPPIRDYLTDPNHFVRHVPLAVLATGLMILAAGCLFVGVVLHAVNWRLMELHSVITRQYVSRKIR
jgi:glycosyltransferase involved in cell wall biosynthesis